MAKVSISEAVHVSISIDGEAVDLDLTAGDNDVDQVIADLLISQGLASESTSKNSTSKKTSSTPVVEETPTTSESTEAN